MENLVKAKTGSRRKVHKDQSAKPIQADAGSNGLTADTVLVYLGRIEQEEALVAKAKKRLGRLWKLAINDGVVRKDLELVRKFQNEDPDTVLNTIKRIKTYAEWMDVPIGAQLSLLEGPTGSILKADEWADRAYRAGFVRGVQGLFEDKQAYPPDNEFHQKHLEGWHAGQKVWLDRIAKIDMALDSDKKDEDPPPDEAPEASQPAGSNAD